MKAPQLTEDSAQFELVSTHRHLAVALDPLGQYFGLTDREAERLVAAGRGMIEPRLGAARARAGLPILAALGLQVEIRAPLAPIEEDRFDLSIRAAEGPDRDAVCRILTGRGIACTVSPSAFSGPAGLVLADLTMANAESIQRALSPLRQVRVVLSACKSARYDLFRHPESDFSEAADLLRFVAVLGYESKGPVPALATGLDRRNALLMMKRFPSACLMAVDQAFQLYDLVLTGPGHLSVSELRDFLAARGAHAVDVLRDIRSGAGVRVESNLTRRAAQAFLADYAVIGLPARAELVRADPARKNR